MKITCNSESKEVTENINLEEFIKGLDLNPDTVVAECDSVIIAREDYSTHILIEGAVLELIRFVGGG